MTPSSSVPYMSTSQEVKSPFLPDLKPTVSSLHPSPPGKCHLLSAQVGRAPESPAGNLGGGGAPHFYLLLMDLFAKPNSKYGSSL